jgi:hypothetical protein
MEREERRGEERKLVRLVVSDFMQSPQSVYNTTNCATFGFPTKPWQGQTRIEGLFG